MGRGKIEIKRIENLNNRQVTFSKRRGGIMKKAKEIAVLCDAHISVVIFGNSGKMHEFCSPKPLIDILEKYHGQSGIKLWDAKHQNLSDEVDRIKKENDSMQIDLRHLKGEDITSLNHKELMALEAALENGLTCIRNKQSEFSRMVETNVKTLEEERKNLNYKLYQTIGDHQNQEMHHDHHHVDHNNTNDNDGYQKMRDYNTCHIPFSFRGQPMQPNLHNRI